MASQMAKDSSPECATFTSAATSLGLPTQQAPRALSWSQHLTQGALMLKRLAPLAIAGTVGFLLASLLNSGTPASAVSTTSDPVKLINYSTCLNYQVKSVSRDYDTYFKLYSKDCTKYLK